MLREYAFNEVGSLKVHGRTNGCLNPLTLFWTASGFEVNVTGSELWLEVEGDYSVQEPWISTGEGNGFACSGEEIPKQ